MSRLFCELDGGKKIYSVSFPFNCREVDGSFIFSSRGGVEVDNRISSEIVALIDRPDGVLDVVAFEGFIDPLFEALEVDLSIWSVVRELMTAEESYLRYDWDAERVNGHRHPLHHIDVGYSSACSFKFGLRQRIGRDGLISILNIDSDCHYIAPAI
ncbi:hypothetical protein [Xanthomonas euvesicatoria]|uniref:hypothetical protein n=1 Tax=Xanthomonas euvesicatoria TaxID=456327 RepID=UPI00123752F4|nr:hypothetical protein [Xanthomonas euvesicatoria]